MLKQRFAHGAILVFLISAHGPGGEPPTCTTHFFDWYVVDGPAALEQKQKQWTYRIDWGWLGIQPQEIGRSVEYYRTQCQKIREAGFDGIHYEWHGNPLKAEFRRALEETGVKVAMFYDMQIRFHPRPQFITPTDEFARQFIEDVAGFYRPIPEDLWLRDRNGRLPIIVYGYAFDTGVSDPARWDGFYRAILAGLRRELGRPFVLHWTDTGLPQQLYAFQHFPEIASFTFNEAGRQTQVNAQSVTFVVHYDDLGVSFTRGGPRQRRWIRNDLRYLQESLWLALHTDPDLVFNYGWNELYEGEHLLPDDHWGTWRYELASAIVRHIKQRARRDLPPVLVIADDLLPAIHQAEGEEVAVLRRQLALLGRLRALVPQADVVLPGQPVDWGAYQVIFSLHTRKDPDQERRLAQSDQTVVYANPDPEADTPMTRLFTDRPRAPVQRPVANEFVVASCPVDVDLERYPFLEYRAKNSPGTVFHIRYEGIGAEGQPVPAWYESSPTDDRASGGQWLTGREDVARIARRGAGQPVRRLTRIDVILDDLDRNGPFQLDLDYLRLVSASGQVGWEEPFDTVDRWRVHASFEGQEGAERRFALEAVRQGEDGLGRLRLEAVVSSAAADGVDESTRRIEPREGVRVLATAPNRPLPLLLARGRRYWLNTYSPSDACLTALVPELFGSPPSRGVLFGSYSHAVTPDGLSSQRAESLMTVGEEPLPVPRFRLVAPPELDAPLEHTLPRAGGPLRLHVLRGEREEIPLPKPGSDPPAVELLPGEVVELVVER